jgi:serine/threonine protein phosphatase PrpC
MLAPGREYADYRMISSTSGNDRNDVDCRAIQEGTVRVEETRLIVGGATDAGNVREMNEDLLYIPDQSVIDAKDRVILAIADGMGGHDRGEVASRVAIDTLLEKFKDETQNDIVLLLKQAYREANKLVFEDGSAKGEHAIMGTTLVTAVIAGDDLTIANVGDSRAYLLRAGRLNQVTTDHSLVAEQVRMGVMSEDEARESSHKNIITRAIGHRERVDVDIFEIKLLPEDKLLLSSDGIHDYLNDDQILDVVKQNDPETATTALVKQAMDAGSTDNLSVICAWLAPLSVIEPPATEQLSGAPNKLIPILVGVGLLILIAIFAYIYFLA